MILLLFLILNPDQEIYNWVKDRRTPFTTQMMEITSGSADFQNFIYFTAGYNFLGSEKTLQETRVLWVALLTTGILTVGLKWTTGRARPEGVSPRINSSFPSGHTSGAFAFSTIMGNYHPSFRIPLFLWAGLVGFARIYLGRHWTSDVLSGALLGFSISSVVWKYRSPIENLSILK